MDGPRRSSSPELLRAASPPHDVEPGWSSPRSQQMGLGKPSSKKQRHKFTQKYRSPHRGPLEGSLDAQLSKTARVLSVAEA